MCFEYAWIDVDWLRAPSKPPGRTVLLGEKVVELMFIYLDMEMIYTFGATLSFKDTSAESILSFLSLPDCKYESVTRWTIATPMKDGEVNF